MLWINPANMAFDSSARTGAWWSSDSELDVWSFAATTGTGPFQLGLQNAQDRRISETQSHWAIDAAGAHRVGRRVAIGGLARWNLIDERDNFVSFDAAGSWRPTRWLGLGVTTRNIGHPDPEGLRRPQTGAGVALRPWGPRAVFGFDAQRRFGSDTAGVGHIDTAQLSAQVVPRHGLYIRAHAAIDAPEQGDTTFGAGLGIGLVFGETQFSIHGQSAASENLVMTGHIGAAPTGEPLTQRSSGIHQMRISGSPPDHSGPRWLGDKRDTWLDTLLALRRAARDPQIKGLVLHFERSQLSLPRYGELRRRISELESRGKSVTAVLHGDASMGLLYAASAASHVVANPVSTLAFTGFSTQLTHFGDLLDWAGIEPQYVRRSEYKGGPEPFTRSSPSDEALESANALLDSLFDEVVDRIAQGRDVHADTVKDWIDGGPYTAEEAHELGLVDALAHPDELWKGLKSVYPGSAKAGPWIAGNTPSDGWSNPAGIGLIHISGAIVDGPSQRSSLFGGATSGDETVIKQIERAMSDTSIKALVVRVDSPGGSALASDKIWRAMQRAAESNKPVIVSMGDVAASGGYYVSAPANRIWAEPTTITGSIGVYAGKFAVPELLKKIKVSSHAVTRGEHARIFSPQTPWSDSERDRMQVLVDAIYDTFKKRVADGRDLSDDAVERIAQGRVWTGLQAKRRRLVDDLGSLDDAINDARKRAGISPNKQIRIVPITEKRTPLDDLTNTLVRATADAEDQQWQHVREWLSPSEFAWIPLLHPQTAVWALPSLLMEANP